jgi:membrane protein YqaA with SNARE-associated domain
MTISRLAITGAIVLNIPTLFATAALPATAVVISALVLATVGAALGAVTGWAIAGPAAEPAVGTIAASQRDERLAA